VLGDLVYAIGGKFSLRTAERYDYKMNQWSLIASMNKAHSHGSAAVLNGNMNPVRVARKLMHNDEVCLFAHIFRCKNSPLTFSCKNAPLSFSMSVCLSVRTSQLKNG
jgi:hypothetical protein